MGKIVISENITLDGVVQDPTGEEGVGYASWTSPLPERDLEEWAKVLFDEALGTEALLLGRRSDDWFASRWLGRGGAWADRLNSIPKYVVSATLGEPRWGNSTVLKGDVVTEVQQLRQQLDGDILVIGSTQLAHALLEHDLADELRLMLYPVVLGAGQRLLGEAGDRKPMRLVRVQPVGDRLTRLTYERDRDA
jgi:dihydrofolate reductase